MEAVMGMIELKKAFVIISRNMSRADFEGEKSEQIISSAEAVLGLTFPATYKMFLLTYGCGDIGGHEFYGIIGDDFHNSGVPDAIWITLRERVESGLPSHLVIVYDQGDGTYCALDCADPRELDECTVVAWVPGVSQPGDRLEIVAEDFGNFFLEKIESSL
jgi:hypothetical protein